MQNLETLFNNYVPEEHSSIDTVIFNLQHNSLTSLDIERLEVSFGRDLRAIQLTRLITYFAECQNENAAANSYDGYFTKDLWTIMHKTFFKKDLLNRLKNELQNLGMLDVLRSESYQASCRYRLNFDAIKAFLESKENEYAEYFHEEEDYIEKYEQTKERVIHENKRKNLRKQHGKTNIWKKISRDLQEENYVELVKDGLTNTELYIFKAISVGMQHYQHTNFEGSCKFYNELMMYLSGYSYDKALKEIEQSEVYDTVEELREDKIRENTTLQAIIEAFNPRNYPEDKSGTLSPETKFIEGHRRASWFTHNGDFYFNYFFKC